MYIRLLYSFIIVGLLSIGGGYSTIVLVQDVAKKFVGLSDEMMTNFVAIAESTPGPMSVNIATFVGAEKAGILGAIIATIGVILPAFVIILLFAVFFTKFLKYKKVQRTFDFIRPCIVGIIMAVGLMMFSENMDMSDKNKALKSIMVMLVIILIIPLYKKLMKKKISAIMLIIVGAFLGIAINYII